ncbi:unnamed protein product, partial [Adineta steineri]
DALKYAKKAIFLGRMIYDDDYERYLITVKDIIMAKVPMKHRIGFDKYLV